MKSSHLVLLTQRFMPIFSTPLRGASQCATEALRRRTSPEYPVSLAEFHPAVPKNQEVKGARFLVTPFPWTLRCHAKSLLFDGFFSLVGYHRRAVRSAPETGVVVRTAENLDTCRNHNKSAMSLRICRLSSLKLRSLSADPDVPGWSS